MNYGYSAAMTYGYETIEQPHTATCGYYHEDDDTYCERAADAVFDLEWFPGKTASDEYVDDYITVCFGHAIELASDLGGGDKRMRASAKRLHAHRLERITEESREANIARRAAKRKAMNGMMGKRTR